MDFEDVHPAFKVGEAELDLSVDSAGSHQGWVKSIGPVCCHKDFDVTSGLESVHLVHDLQHSSLDFIVRPSIGSSTSDGIDFVEEDNTSFLGSGHLENLSDHPGTLSHILLHKF